MGLRERERSLAKYCVGVEVAKKRGCVKEPTFYAVEWKAVKAVLGKRKKRLSPKPRAYPELSLP